MEIKEATVVQILPTKVWIESGMLGERAVMLQHQDCEPFEYAVFNYDYRYTSNHGTITAAESLARALGATDPIEHKRRELGPLPTAGELREQIACLTEVLAAMEDAEPAR